MSLAKTITVDIVSDTICPWCFVGKRRIEAAARAVPGANIVYRWHPFQLDATLPVEGVNKLERYEKKFGQQGVQAMLPRMAETGKREGITFDYGGLIANTVDSHRLLEWASRKGGPALQHALVEQLFSFYFERRGNLGDRAALATEAAAVGLDAAEARTFLDSDELREEVLKEAKRWAIKHSVTGVPFFVINDRLRVSGAQDTAVFTDIFREIVEE